MANPKKRTPISKARLVRARKLEILRSLGDDTLKVAAVLRSPPVALKSCTLWDVLNATYNLGPAGARDICEAARVFPALSLGVLTPAERQRVIQKLPKRAQ